MTQALETRDQASIIEQALVQGDLKDLTPAQRFSYYSQVCDSLRLNKFTKPFDYLHLNGKVVLYATKNCTDQLRDIHGVSIVGLEHEQIGSLYVVTARAIDKEGRQDSSIGAVPIENLKGEALANAMMKTETKAKRRVTLSLCGLGMLDESELETIPDARVEVEQAAVPKPSTEMVTSARSREAVRWAEIVEEARRLEVKFDDLAYELPISVAELTRKAELLKGRINAKKEALANPPARKDVERLIAELGHRPVKAVNIIVCARCLVRWPCLAAHLKLAKR